MATTPKKAASKASKKKSQPVSSLDLSSLVREETRETFTVTLPNGDEVSIIDPQDLDYVDVAGNPNILEVFELAMSDEDYEKLLVEGGLKAWQFGEIFNKWREWYGLGTPGESNA